jgi:hypothetical protein
LVSKLRPHNTAAAANPVKSFDGGIQNWIAKNKHLNWLEARPAYPTCLKPVASRFAISTFSNQTRVSAIIKKNVLIGVVHVFNNALSNRAAFHVRLVAFTTSANNTTPFDEAIFFNLLGQPISDLEKYSLRQISNEWR